MKPGYANEFYLIEKTVEIVVGHDCFRIEVLRDDSANKPFSTRAYQKDHIVAQPAYPWANGSYQRKPETFDIWKSIDIGWTQQSTADGALSQALGFLGERFPEKC